MHVAPIKVVIADDNEEFCRVLSDFIGNYPQLQVVGVAHDGLQVVKIVEDIFPDVIVLDIVMPNMDGLSVLEWLRRRRSEHRPKVVVLTAFGQEEMTRKAVELGADYYIVKPFDLATLVRRITEIARVNDPVQPQPDSETERAVAQIVQKLRIPPSLKGYTYLREAILLVAMDSTAITDATKGLYPCIAAKYQTTAERVERAMRFAIETVWNRSDVEFLQSLFGYGVDERKGKPTNTSFIAKVADQIRLELLTRKVARQAR